MAAGHGSGGSVGWDEGGPIGLWCAISLPLIVVGVMLRPRFQDVLDAEEELLCENQSSSSSEPEHDLPLPNKTGEPDETGEPDAPSVRMLTTSG